MTPRPFIRCPTLHADDDGEGQERVGRAVKPGERAVGGQFPSPDFLAAGDASCI